MIRTKPLSDDGKVEVAFVLPSIPEGPLSVVGDFNDWDPYTTPMTSGHQGYEAKVTVDAGRRYAFRYLGVDGSWFNDEAAHMYEPGPYGSDNSVIDVTDVITLTPSAPAPEATAPAPRKPRAKKARA